jgi:hypothetical protein
MAKASHRSTSIKIVLAAGSDWTSARSHALVLALPYAVRAAESAACVAPVAAKEPRSVHASYLLTDPNQVRRPNPRGPCAFLRVPGNPRLKSALPRCHNGAIAHFIVVL